MIGIGKFGYYYKGLRPFVSSLNVSTYDGLYYLEHEDGFDNTNIVGVFKGYPCEMKKHDLLYGFSFATGILKLNDVEDELNIGSYLKKKRETIGKFEKNEYFPKLVKRCTEISTLVDSLNKLSVQQDFSYDNIIGKFEGEPGEWYNVPVENGTIANKRRFGFEHAKGKIILNEHSICKNNKLYNDLIFKSEFRGESNYELKYEFVDIIPFEYSLNKGIIEEVKI